MIARKVARFGAGAVNHPIRTGRAVGRYPRQNPAPTVVLLVGALATLNMVRGGTFPPTASQGIAWVGAAIAFVLVAQVAPELVTSSLLLVLLYVALTNVTLIESLMSDLTTRLGGVATAGGPRPKPE